MNRATVATLHQLRKMRDWYVIRQASGVTLPTQQLEPLERRHFVFHGKVQKVGFRLLLKSLADRMHITGWVVNNENLDVEAEIQGTPTQLAFLEDYFMHGVRRITVTAVEEHNCDLALDENQFLIK